MDIDVTRPEQGWTERALAFLPGTVVQYLSTAGCLVRAKRAGELWHIQSKPDGQPRARITGSALLADLGDAPRLRVLAVV